MKVSRQMAKNVYFLDDRKFKEVAMLTMPKQEWHEFLSEIMWYEVIASEGACNELWERIKPYSKIYGDKAQFDRLREDITKTVANLMLGRDSLVYDKFKIVKLDGHDLDTRTVKYNHLMPNIQEKGIHALHLAVASGKTKLIKDDIAHNYYEDFKEVIKHNKKRNNRGGSIKKVCLLCISPNQNDVYELTRELQDAFPEMEWKHYHEFGQKPEDIVRAIKECRRLVICGASLRQYNELASRYHKFETDLNYYQAIWVDEVHQIMTTYAIHSKPQFHNSLPLLYKLLLKTDRAMLLSADINEANTLEVFGRIAHEKQAVLYYYKNNIDFAEGMHFTFYEHEAEIVKRLIDRVNGGESAFVAVDFANGESSDEKPRLKAFVKYLQTHCPDKKIKAFSSADMNTNPHGMLIKEIGLQAYCEQQRKAGELDMFICTPWAKTNVSVIFDDELSEFDFSCGIHRGVNDAWIIFQAARRCRQINDHLVYCKNRRIQPVYPDSGEKEVAKTHRWTQETLESLKPEVRLTVHSQVQAYQLKKQNDANPRWLAKLVIMSRGGRILQGNAWPNNDLSEEGLKKEKTLLRKVYNDEVIKVERPGTDYDLSNAHLRHNLRDKFISFDDKTKNWVNIYDEKGINYAELEQVDRDINIDIARNLCYVANSNLIQREVDELGSLDGQYVLTGELLDLIFVKAAGFANFAQLCEWYLTANNGTCFYYELPHEEQHDINQLLKDNYTTFYKPSLGIDKGTCNDLGSFLLDTIGKHLELDIFLTKTPRRKGATKTGHKKKLFAQYLKSHPKDMKKSCKGAIEHNYRVIEEILLNKVRDNPSPERLTDAEKWMLDWIPYVLKIKRPNRPIYNLVYLAHNKINEENQAHRKLERKYI